LQDESVEVLKQFGTAVGYLDKEMQKKNIEILLGKLRHIYTRDQENYEKKSKLNTTIGMLAGVCVAIILV
ncbi:MAG: stage III sporulation protein AB, partial [Cellulosilyticaceae bacterium]